MIEFSIRQPISTWNKPLRADFRTLFHALAKAGISSVTLDWSRAAKEATEAISAVGLETKPGEMAWLLIHRALIRAFYALVSEQSPQLFEERRGVEELSESFRALEEQEIDIHQRLFEQPADLPLLEILRKPFGDWLIGVGLTEARARAVAARLPRYFVFGLAEEWQARAKEYAVIEESLSTPFSNGIARQFQWQRYNAWLERQVEEPVFEEGFSLRQIYIPLRGFWIERDKKERHVPLQERSVKHHILLLEEELRSWVEKADPQDSIRVLSGGPGSGKSSFAKMFAAQAARADRRVVLVPLQYFEPSDDLVEALNEFAERDPYLPTELIDPKSDQQTLLILDGLDELALQGRIARENAQKFVRQVRRTVDQLNRGRLRLQVLICGREVVVQEAREEVLERHILHLLPYLVVQDWNAWPDKEVEDPRKILRQDQRDAWWSRYGELSGRGYGALPKELAGDGLEEITAQPLLNYLVALSFVRGKVQFSADTNLNSVYGDLLAAVYERAWEGHQYRQLEGIGQEKFERVLEEVALAAWHGNGRTTTVAAVERQCESSGLHSWLAALEEGAKSGVTRLLTAFYFRQSGREVGSGERTFEFTHKSFGEFLTARRITRLLEVTRRQFEVRSDNADMGWDEGEALGAWLNICGPSVMDHDLYQFILYECSLSGKKTCTEWQGVLIRLVNHRLARGWPMDRVAPRPSYREEKRLARNAGETLLALLSACSRVTRVVSKIAWPAATSFGDLICELRGQRQSGQNPLALNCLNRLDLSSQALDMTDLYGAYLQGASLQGVRLYSATLQGASLRGASLKDAYLQRASLQGADLQLANLQEAELEGASFQEASLQEANLQEASLQHASLHRANLQRANLQRADLQEANLQEANLQEANLQEADLQDAILKEVILRGANLRGASLRGANLQEAELQGASLRGVSLKDAILRGVDLQGANLQDAILQRADLEGASLEGGDLRGVDLQDADLRDANLQNANLQDVNLRDAILRGVDLRGAILEGASLEGAKGLNRKQIEELEISTPAKGPEGAAP